MEIDVRKLSEQKVEVIRFADETTISSSRYQADVIQFLEDCGCFEVQIKESGNSDYVRLYSKHHAENLIKALQKAIELGWLK